MSKPSGPGKRKTLVIGRLLAKFRMAAAKVRPPKRKATPKAIPNRAIRRSPKPKACRRRNRRPKR